jgi:hypothetical protein
MGKLRELSLTYRVGQQVRVIVAVGPDGALVEEGTIREIEEDLDEDGRLQSYQLVVSTRGFKEGIIVSVPAVI